MTTKLTIEETNKIQWLIFGAVINISACIEDEEKAKEIITPLSEIAQVLNHLESNLYKEQMNWQIVEYDNTNLFKCW